MYFALISSLLVWIRSTHKSPTDQLTQPRESDCSPVHVFAARGSGEPAGPGTIGRLAELIQRDNPRTDTVEAIDYPALLDPNDPTRYAFSTHIGVSAVMWQVTNYYNRCPNSKVVLLGYSQVEAINSIGEFFNIRKGAHIIGDALCGGGGWETYQEQNVLGPSNCPMNRTVGAQGSYPFGSPSRYNTV